MPMQLKQVHEQRPVSAPQGASSARAAPRAIVGGGELLSRRFHGLDDLDFGRDRAPRLVATSFCFGTVPGQALVITSAGRRMVRAAEFGFVISWTWIEQRER